MKFESNENVFFTLENVICKTTAIYLYVLRCNPPFTQTWYAFTRMKRYELGQNSYCLSFYGAIPIVYHSMGPFLLFIILWGHSYLSLYGAIPIVYHSMGPFLLFIILWGHSYCLSLYGAIPIVYHYMGPFLLFIILWAFTLWRHQMELFSASLSHMFGNSNMDLWCFFVVSLNKLLNKNYWPVIQYVKTVIWHNCNDINQRWFSFRPGTEHVASHNWNQWWDIICDQHEQIRIFFRFKCIHTKKCIWHSKCRLSNFRHFIHWPFS